MTVPPRPGILDVAPYRLGDWTIPGVERVIRLASNECATAPSPRAIAAYEAFADEIRRYPDGFTGPLREAIAAHHGLEARRIVLGAGSEELIALIARAYVGPGDEVLHGAHDYLLFALAARTAGASARAVPMPAGALAPEAAHACVTARTRLMYLANPCNPTGACLGRAEIERLRAGLPDDVLLVLDGAYAEYAMRADYEAGAALVEAADNVVMLRTFSKIYGLAGLRVGWAYCPRPVAEVLERVRPPSNVAGPALVVAAAALDDRARLAKLRRENARRREAFAARAAAAGLAPAPSEGNFVLVRFPAGAPSARAADAHLRAHGILVRPMNAYGLDDCLRVTIGDDAEMDALGDALAAFAA